MWLPVPSLLCIKTNSFLLPLKINLNWLGTFYKSFIVQTRQSIERNKSYVNWCFAINNTNFWLYFLYSSSWVIIRTCTLSVVTRNTTLKLLVLINGERSQVFSVLSSTSHDIFFPILSHLPYKVLCHYMLL